MIGDSDGNAHGWTVIHYLWIVTDSINDVL